MTPISHPARRALVPAALVLGAIALVTWRPRDDLYTSMAETTADLPASDQVGLLADKGLVLLVALVAGLAVLTWLRDRPAFVLLTSAGVGVVAAYLVSEAVKLLVAQERPCRGLDAGTVLACPEPGDWSWPSNHATIAGALTTACILVAPRVWPLAVPLAAAIAGARVGAGVHYVHDVAAGLALGVLVTFIATRTIHPAVTNRNHVARSQPSTARPTVLRHRVASE